MAIQYINTGTSSNSGNGDSIRSAFNKVNQNFDSILESINNAPATTQNPTFDSLTVTNATTLLGPLYLGTGTISISPNTGALIVNGNPLLGNYKFLQDTMYVPGNAQINSIGSSGSPSIGFRNNINPGIAGSGVLSVSAGLASFRASTEFSFSGTQIINPGSTITALNGRITQYGEYSGLVATSPNATGPYLAGDPRLSFDFTSDLSQSTDYISGLLSNSTGTLTGIMANSRGVWINGGLDGVTIATSTSSYGWQFRTDGSILFPDGSIQTTAAGSSSTALGDRLTSGTSALVLSANGSLVLDQQGAYNGIDVPGTLFRIDTNQPNYTQMTLQNKSGANTATSDIMWVRDDGDVSAGTGLLDVGINSSVYVEEEAYGLHTPGSAYMFANDADLIIGTQTPGKRLIFHANGTTANDSVVVVDGYTWRFNRTVQTIVATPGPLNFTVWNTQNNAASQAIYQAMNDAGDYLKLGINSTNAGAEYGNIGPREGFVHIDGSTATLHIGGSGNLVFWSEESTGGYENGTTATLVMSKADRSSTFGGHLLPAEDLAYDLGSSSTQWRSLWVGTSTIYIGGIPISINTTSNTLVVGATPGTTSTTATNLATESYVINYVNQFGGAGLEIDGGYASTNYTAEMEIDGGEA